MGFLSWLRNRTSNRALRGRTQRRPAAPRFRPQLEALEDRMVPAQIGLTVNSLADSGPGTLRAAILDADTRSHSDKVTIDFSVTGTIDLQTPLPDLNNTIAIQGPGAVNLTVERADGYSFASAIVTVDADQTVSLDGLRIANGNDGGIVNNGTLTVTNSAVENNSATALGNVGGGGIKNVFGATLTVGDCSLSGNSGSDGGGILNFNGATLTISGSTLSGNSATIEGGGIFNDGSLTVSGCNITGNTATVAAHGFGFGGGILNAGTMTVLRASGFSNNTAVLGGGIFNIGAMTVSDCGFTCNAATGSSFNTGGGGAICNLATAAVQQCTFSSNSAILGGGIQNESQLTVLGCTFTGNNAASEGGAIDNTNEGTLVVRGSTFTGNTAGDSGGAIYNDAFGILGIRGTGTLDVRGSTFTGNSAGDSGGAIYNSGTATMQESTLSLNTAGSAGGGLFNDASGTLAVKDSTVLSNVAPLGADLYNLGALTLDDSTVGVIGP
jgi:predicted outer membrane repeat protein